MALVKAGETFEAVYESGVSGQVGTVAVRIDDNQGATVFGPVTAGVIELGTTGVYSRDLTAPGVAGTQWSILWSYDGTFDPKTTSTDDLYVVTADEFATVPPLLPITGAVSVGPCSSWTTVEDIAACCGVDSDTSILEAPMVAASQVLYALSSKRWTGTCTRRVRPCSSSGCNGPYGGWVGTGWGGGGDWNLGVYGLWETRERPPCGCSHLDRVPLAGHATDVLEVTIDGMIVAADTYRLDENRWLTRTPEAADPDTRLYWPSCQDLSLPESEDGTFSILYEFGMDPPQAGVLAATELACAIHQTCAGGGSLGECPLPNGVVKIVRQGIEIELSPFASWGMKDGAWRTGLPLVDLFLNTYNPTGRRRRRSAVWSPDMPRFARPEGA